VKAEALAVLVLLALVFSGDSHGHTPSPPRPGPGPAGPSKPKARSWTGSAAAWTQSRYAEALKILEAQDLPLGVDAEEVATSVVAHWAIETAWGANEYNFNLGGIHAASGQPYFSALDAGVPTRFVAYGSLDEGIQAYADLLQARYKSCAVKLFVNPTAADWYVCLGSLGYYGHNPSAETLFNTTRSKVAAFLKGA
jgi:hypothetical protein